MKVVFFCYEGYERPSARIRAYRFAEELRRRGADSEVVSISDLFHLSGREPYRLPDWKKIAYNFRIFLQRSPEPEAIYVLQKVAYHCLAPLWLKQLHGNRLVLDFDDWDFGYQPFRALRLFGQHSIKKINRRLLAAADAVTVSSEHLASAVRNLSPSNLPMHLIPTGVDLNQPYQPNHDFSSKKFIFTWTGQVWGNRIYESILILIQAIALLPQDLPVQLELRGAYYSYETALRRVIASHHLENRISILPWLAPEKIPEYLAHADCGLYVLRDDDDYNLSKSPTKIFEYMAAGLPTIASPIGEALRVLESERTGLFARTPREWAAMMLRLAAHREAASRLGFAARQAVEQRFSLAKLGEDLFEIYRGLR